MQIGPELTEGSLFANRERGSVRLWRVVRSEQARDGWAYTGVRRPIEVGETVFRCVWAGAGDRIEVRASHVVRPGDVAWVDAGVPGFDGQRIFVNRATAAAPRWMRSD